MSGSPVPLIKSHLFVLLLNLTIPYKFARYLFPITIPISYFSVKLLKKPAFFLLFLLTPFFYQPLENPQPYIDAVSRINKSCMVLSNAWPFINYLGVNAGPEPRPSQLHYYINQGYTIIHFKFIKEPIYNSTSLPVFFENDKYFIIKQGCHPPCYYNKSYLEELANSQSSSILLPSAAS